MIKPVGLLGEYFKVQGDSVKGSGTKKASDNWPDSRPVRGSFTTKREHYARNTDRQQRE